LAMNSSRISTLLFARIYKDLHLLISPIPSGLSLVGLAGAGAATAAAVAAANGRGGHRARHRARHQRQTCVTRDEVTLKSFPAIDSFHAALQIARDVCIVPPHIAAPERVRLDTVHEGLPRAHAGRPRKTGEAVC